MGTCGNISCIKNNYDNIKLSSTHLYVVNDLKVEFFSVETGWWDWCIKNT